MFKVVNTSNGRVVVENMYIADTFILRLKGLMFRRSIEKNEGLLIRPCKIVHTFGMKFTIDVVFLSKYNDVVYIMKNLKPNKVTTYVNTAYSVLELHEGCVFDNSIKCGDKVSILDKNKVARL